MTYYDVKTLFQQTVADEFRVLLGCNNKYGRRENKIINANDSVAFAASGEEYAKRNKKKEITGYKSKKTTPMDVTRRRPSKHPIKKDRISLYSKNQI